MTRALLSFGTALCLLSPAFAQDAGLPGSPVLPSSGATAPVNTATPGSGAPTLKDMGLAVAGYMGDLLKEDPTLEFGVWYALGNYPGAQFRFETKRLGVEINQGFGGEAPHHRKLRFADVINDKVVVEFRQDAERFRGLGSSETELVGGYQFDTKMPLQARFEAKMFQDTPSESGYDRYRAVLQATTLDFGTKDDVVRAGLTMRVGLERASIDGHGANRIVAGQRANFGLGDNIVTGAAIDFYVDLESAYGGYDGGGSSRGFTTALGTTIAANNWQLGWETASVREKGLPDRSFNMRRHRVFGELNFDSGIRLDGELTLLRVKNDMTPGFAGRETRFRSSFGVGYKWLHAGTEFGQDLDGQWRPRVTAGVRIPLGGK